MANQTDTAHQTLIKILKENEHLLGVINPKIRKHTGSGSFSEIENTDINNAAALLVDFLHLTGSSLGGFDLYELLQVYFKDEESRRKINAIVNGSD